MEDLKEAREGFVGSRWVDTEEKSILPSADLKSKHVPDGIVHRPTPSTLRGRALESLVTVDKLGMFVFDVASA